MFQPKPWLKYFLGALIFLFSLLTYTFLYGKLFPFSPFAPGFSHHELSRVTLYTQNGIDWRTYEWVDSLVAPVETFHSLKFRSKPKVFFFSDRTTYAHRSFSKARFCAFYNGSIVVSPWAQEEDRVGKISMRIYLTHELSHSLLYQNMAITSIPFFPRWLLEGVATYSAEQTGTSFYPSEKETKQLICNGNWMPPEFFETRKEKTVHLDVQNPPCFMYSEFALIVKDLDTHYGHQKFLEYVSKLLSTNGNGAIFKQVFGEDFDLYLRKLKQSLVSPS